MVSEEVMAVLLLNKCEFVISIIDAKRFDHGINLTFHVLISKWLAKETTTGPFIAVLLILHPEEY